MVDVVLGIDDSHPELAYWSDETVRHSESTSNDRQIRKRAGTILRGNS
jgi:hypothetical protein